MEEKKPEFYKQDRFQYKMKAIQNEVGARLGDETLGRILDYGFDRACNDAEEFGLKPSEECLESMVMFNRLCRFRIEHALLEVFEYARKQIAEGITLDDLREQLTSEKIGKIANFQ